jgi:large subunit ribosomal protein L24
MKIGKGDNVQVISGDEQGKRGKVLKVFPGRNRAIVEGVNFIIRHTRPTRVNQQGGRLEREPPLNVSNLMLICPSCDNPTRANMKRQADGTRLRTCHRCGEIIEENRS